MTKAKRPKLVRLDVVWSKRERAWAVKGFGMRWPTQGEAALWARTRGTQRDILALLDAAGVTVRIHRRDGRIREERTYPRSADPKRSRG
jgi:hypothetical protein